MTEQTQLFELSKFVSENSYNYTNIMNEAAVTLSDAVLSKMFELTIGKYNKIDFSEIERSRGDVTKTRFYKNLNECINTLMDIQTVTNKIPSIIIVSDALNNLYMMKNTFEYNFRIKNNVAIMIYNSIYYAIMEATSYIIAVSIDVAKSDNNISEIKIYTLGEKTMTLINSLAAFNKAVADNSLNKFLKESVNTEEALTESVAGKIGETALNVAIDFISGHKKEIKTIGTAATVVIGLLYLGSHIIPIIREIVYWIFKCRQKISDAAALQAKFLELNIESLEHMDPNAKVGRSKKITSEKLITRQTRYMNMFKSISDKFALDADKTSRDARIDIKQDKVDVSDVII